MPGGASISHTDTFAAPAEAARPQPAALAPTIRDLRPVLAPDVTATRVVWRGAPTWVMHNPASAKYFRAHPRLYRLLQSLDGTQTVDAALAGLPQAGPSDPDDDGLLAGIVGMLRAGILRQPGRRAMLPAKPGPSLLSVMRHGVFARIDIGDLGRALPVAGPMIGWLFTGPGFAVWSLLVTAAVALWVPRAPQVIESFRDLADFRVLDAVSAFVVFTAVKLVHETGHALCAQRMAAAEGMRVSVFKWGIGLMFLMPAPWVDVSATWSIGNRWRRAAVGMAGIYMDAMIAAIAAILWAFSGPGPVREILFQTVLVCGASSLLFNANPLVRLDGYYVVSDLLEMANLQARGTRSLLGLVRAPLGLGQLPRGADLGFAAWAAASIAYRWTVYLGVFWLAASMHWLLGMAAVTMIGTLFVVTPLLAGLKALLRAPAFDAWKTLRAGGVIAALLAGLLLVPLPDTVIAEGVVERDGTIEVFAGADGIVTEVAPGGAVTAGAALLRLSNPETLLKLQQLTIERDAEAVEARLAIANDPGHIDSVSQQRLATERQIDDLHDEIAAWRSINTLDRGAVWIPARAEALQGAWVRRDDPRPLGVLAATQGDPVLRVVLDQRDGPLVLADLHDGAAMSLRPRGGTTAVFDAIVVAGRPVASGELPSAALALEAGGRIPARRDPRGAMVAAERVFEIRLKPQDLATFPALMHGQRVEARISLPPAPIGLQLWRHARQVLQQRLAV